VSEQVATDRRLARARAGDGAAFDELLAPLLDPAFRLAMTMLKDRSTAEDAVQEAAFKTWRKLDRVRDGADLKPWFLAIVANECRSIRRSRWWRVLLPGQVLPEQRPVASDARWSDRVDLDAALDRLDRQHLLALTLYYQLDLPIEEVARVFRCSEGAARQRIHRALAALRPELAMEVNL
jgi:RNA polymerase sigma-70 factor (ECF subfamily)